MRRAVLMLIGTLAAAAPCAAQASEPLPRFAIDLYGVWAGLPTSAGWVPPVAADTPLPAKGFGVSAGGYMYLVRFGLATLGAGASVLMAQGQGQPKAPISATGTTTTRAATAIVTTRTTSVSPQLSLNFGHRLGWSYLSAGYGVTKVDSTSTAVGTTPAMTAPDGWNPALNFGGGARWFMKDHLGAGFDVRWNKLSSRATTATVPGAKRTQLFSIAIGITLQ